MPFVRSLGLPTGVQSGPPRTLPTPSSRAQNTEILVHACLLDLQSHRLSIDFHLLFPLDRTTPRGERAFPASCKSLLYRAFFDEMVSRLEQRARWEVVLWPSFRPSTCGPAASSQLSLADLLYIQYAAARSACSRSRVARKHMTRLSQLDREPQRPSLGACQAATFDSAPRVEPSGSPEEIEAGRPRDLASHMLTRSAFTPLDLVRTLASQLLHPAEGSFSGQRRALCAYGHG